MQMLLNLTGDVVVLPESAIPKTMSVRVPIHDDLLVSPVPAVAPHVFDKVNIFLFSPQMLSL
jgi:hypothetical protein